MTPLHMRELAYAVEQEVRRHPEVVSCIVDQTGNEQVGRIQVLLRPESNEGDFLIHLNELLASSFGLNLDQSQIVVSKVGTGRAKVLQTEYRARISNITFVADRSNGEAKVALSLEDKEGVGQTFGQLTSQQRLRLIAEATLLAVEDLTELKNQFSLENVSEITLLDQPVIVVLVHCFDPLNKVLSGACPISPDEGLDQAVVRATLSAINRVTTRFFFQSQQS